MPGSQQPRDVVVPGENPEPERVLVDRRLFPQHVVVRVRVVRETGSERVEQRLGGGHPLSSYADWACAGCGPAMAGCSANVSSTTRSSLLRFAASAMGAATGSLQASTAVNQRRRTSSGKPSSPPNSASIARRHLSTPAAPC